MKSNKMFALVALVVVLAFCVAACNVSVERKVLTESDSVNTFCANTIQREATTVPSVVADTESVGEVFDPLWIRCVTAEKALWLRDKPWSDSPVVIPNALPKGSALTVYPNDFGYDSGWVEVWSLEFHKSGYVNIEYIGMCDDD